MLNVSAKWQRAVMLDNDINVNCFADNINNFNREYDRQTIHAAEMDDEILVHSDKIADENELEEFDLG